ncbi:MAG: PDC sensor domain-containing protein [Gammaproteobacteria bacterium]|nr:PDC sensor domain-containing protein [Gammaproteobacteria bacterium]
MKKTWKEAISQQRVELARKLLGPLTHIAEACAEVWPERDALDKILLENFDKVPHCLFLYALDAQGVQVSDNVSANGLMPEHFGRDRSNRPYMLEPVPLTGFLLSNAYLSLRANRPSMTALQAVQRDGETLGYIGSDFDLRDLPVTGDVYEESVDWQQIKGDPAIRSVVFQQQRTTSPMDESFDVSIAIIEELITDHGMFQCVLHFSSSRATIWFMDDPYRYRILDHEALSNPDVCLLYPARPYPEDALIPADRIGSILRAMKKLRLTDETFYLRSASINIFNGKISLTFSCDGSHYMSWQEFLEKDESFWFGAVQEAD